MIAGKIISVRDPSWTEIAEEKTPKKMEKLYERI